MINQKKLILVCALLAVSRTFSAALVEEAGKKLLPGSEKKFFTTIIEERQERLAARKKERASLQSADKEFNSTITASTDQLKNQIAGYEQVLKQNPENEFVKQKLESNLEMSIWIGP